uniref:Uncharacterized protein n=1 Tax=Helianthus annuus TaxID=4232 RepID=A0A251S937_HELAN
MVPRTTQQTLIEVWFIFISPKLSMDFLSIEVQDRWMTSLKENITKADFTFSIHQP